MAFFGAMLTDFPFALAKDFQACGIDNDMGNRAKSALDRRLSRLSPLAKLMILLLPLPMMSSCLP
ncbi:hypothetical protein [Vibrio cholerae]|uniref:hypothetical protein n=1 Tax=Vibrio cholerae TaxID=666 RepID=UPI001965F755|nr:hypothetical protein [Vibrio cholerae]